MSAVVIVSSGHHAARMAAQGHRVAAAIPDDAEWILRLEPDEWIDMPPDLVERLLVALPGNAAILPRWDVVAPGRARMDGGFSPGRLRGRLFRRGAAAWEGPWIPLPVMRAVDGAAAVWKRVPEPCDAAVLITAPIRDAEPTLELYLDALRRLAYPRSKISFYWLLNDCTDRTAEILEAWRAEHAADYRSIRVERLDSGTDAARFAFESGEPHAWCAERFSWMAGLRTRCMRQVGDHDFVLFVDSDILLQPWTLGHLTALEGVDVVSEIFWTEWRISATAMPNVWSSGQYTFDVDLLERLRATTTVEPVGGLGAITLIPRRVIEAGVTYMPVPNVDYEGEDRHFCIRAAARGFRLHADTHFPAVHLYRKSILEQYRAALAAG